MKIADTLTTVVEEHMLAESPLAQALAKVADGMDELEARVALLEHEAAREQSE